MIRPVTFLDTRQVAARFVLKYERQLDNGVLKLRDLDDEGEAVDLPILAEWGSASSLLKRIKTGAYALLEGKPAVLGKAWIESLPGGHGTPWLAETDEYAQAHIRTRTCLVPVPDSFSFSGTDRVALGIGIVNVIEHRIPHSEVNLSAYSRVHLVVDIKRPEPDAG